MTANSRTFTADLSCEPATIDPNVTVYCPPESRCTNVYNIMVVHNNDCHMSAFPRDNKTFMVSNNGMGVGSWWGGVLPGTCDGKQDDPDNQRIVVFSLYKDQEQYSFVLQAFFAVTTKHDHNRSIRGSEEGR
jgi:hypothetical protein